MCFCVHRNSRKSLVFQTMITEALVANPEILPVISLTSDAQQRLRMDMILPGIITSPMSVHAFKQIKEVRGKRCDYVGWIMQASLSELSKEERAMRYFVRCSNLFSQMSMGRNQQSLRFLIESHSLALSYAQILAVIKESTLPYFIRARYFKLMCVLYVDRDPQQQTAQIQHTRVWCKVTPEASDLDMAITSQSAHIPVCTTEFLDLMQYVLEELPRLADCVDGAGKTSLSSGPLQGQLEMIKAEIALVDQLVEFGFFVNKEDPEDFSRFGVVMGALFAILDIHGEHGQETPETHSSLEGALKNEVRSEALKTVLRIFDLRLNMVCFLEKDVSYRGI